jgi:glycopeptide antibiotics resistance protein
MSRPFPTRAFGLVRDHPLLTAVTSLYLGVVAWLTLGPQPIGLVKAGGIFDLLAIFQRHTATAWISYPAVEFAANVALFVPIGVLLLLIAGRRWWWLAILSGMLLSASIEIAQLFIPGRVSDVRDLVSNSIGAFVGVLAALVITWPGEVRRRREAQRQQPRTGEIRIA